MRATIPDGLPAVEVIRRVIEAGGIPVLAWSPGKWLFARGRLVRDLIASDQGRILRLGDTTLRPTLWPAPRLMKLAHERGMTVIPGSDPLPLAGEERYAGTYGFIYQGAFDASQPAASIGRMLTGGIARCHILQRDWSPPPRASSCPGFTDYGQGLEVGRSGPGRFVCAGDTARDPSAASLAYGTGSQVGDFVCVSRPAGMTCTNRFNGHGFFVSIQSYQVF